MGSNTNPQKIVQFMEASDIDTRLDPEPLGVFPAIAKLKKKQLHINIELASPQDFLPALPKCRDRSLFIGKYDQVSFYHLSITMSLLPKPLRNFPENFTVI